MMRVLVSLALACFFLIACNKDKYTSAPQIEYKELTSNVYINTTAGDYQPPKIKFSITDAEGDLGDTAYVHIKNLLNGRIDSFPFPNLNGANKKNFKAEVTVNALAGCDGNFPPGHVDTMFYEIYVTDFAKNKSNTISTPEPVYESCD